MRIQVTTEALCEANIDEERIVRESIGQWSKGGQGYVPNKKPDDIFCPLTENVNSLSMYHLDNWKVKKYCAINDRY